MDYFEYMQNLRGRQDNRTRQAQITLDQIAGAGPTGAEIAVQAGQAALGNYTNLLARAQAVKAAQAAAQAEKADRAQALLDKRKEMLYGKVLDRGGALPEEYAGMSAGFQLPEKPVKPIVRTVHDPSGFYFIEQDPNTQQIKVQKAPGVEGKKLSSTLAYYMSRDDARADVDAAEWEYKSAKDAYTISYAQYRDKYYNKSLGRMSSKAPAPPAVPDWNVILARHPLAAKLSKAAPLDYNVNIFGDQTAPAQPAAPTTFDIEG